MRSSTRPCNLNLQLLRTARRSRWKQAAGQPSHPVRHTALLSCVREGLPGADCDNCDLREGNAIPSDILMCDQQPRCTGTTRYQYPHFTLNYVSRRRHRVPQGLPAGDACGPWAKQRATVHNRLEANPKGTFRAAIKALQLSRHVSPLGLRFYSRPRTVSQTS